MNPTNQLFDLKGKIALVSGASRGIGEEIATVLAAHGARVVVASRKIDGCRKVADAIVAKGGQAEAFACHVGDMAQIQAVFDHIKKRHGRLDILVNNAAINPYFGHILDTDLGAFQKTVDVNIRGCFFMSVEAGKIMRDQGGDVAGLLDSLLDQLLNPFSFSWKQRHDFFIHWQLPSHYHQKLHSNLPIGG